MLDRTKGRWARFAERSYDKALQQFTETKVQWKPNYLSWGTDWGVDEWICHWWWMLAPFTGVGVPILNYQYTDIPISDAPRPGFGICRDTDSGLPYASFLLCRGTDVECCPMPVFLCRVPMFECLPHAVFLCRVPTVDACPMPVYWCLGVLIIGIGSDANHLRRHSCLKWNMVLSFQMGSQLRLCLR